MRHNFHPEFNKKLVNKSEIARLLGISRPYVSMLMSGSRKNPEMLERIKSIIKQQLKKV